MQHLEKKTKNKKTNTPPKKNPENHKIITEATKNPMFSQTIAALRKKTRQLFFSFLVFFLVEDNFKLFYVLAVSFHIIHCL